MPILNEFIYRKHRVNNTFYGTIKLFSILTYSSLYEKLKFHLIIRIMMRSMYIYISIFCRKTFLKG